MELCMFMCIFNIKAQKHACFHVFSPFSAHLYPHYIITVKGLLEFLDSRGGGVCACGGGGGD